MYVWVMARWYMPAVVNTDADIKVPSAEDPELAKAVYSREQSRSEYSLACYAYVFPVSFFPIHSLCFFPNPLDLNIKW